MGLYNGILQRLIIPPAEHISGIHFMQLLKELKKSEWLPSEEIKKIQERKMRAVIKNAYENVPYYHRIMKESHLRPDDVNHISDLRKMPILTKEDIRKNLNDFISKQYRKEELVYQASSGSTGEPFEYYISKKQKGINWASIYRIWGWAGYELGDRIAHVQGFPNFAFKNHKNLMKIESKLFRTRFYSSFSIYDKNVEDVLKDIKRFSPRFIKGYPSSIYFLAKYVGERNIDLKVKAIITTGETLTPTQRKIIEEEFNTKVFDTYGGEGMNVSGECSSHIGQHINAENIIVEIVDENGEPVSYGERGEIVLTNLEAFAMPFIRYDIKDVGSLSDEKCPCGRGLPLLKSIEGRLSDVLVTSEGKLLVVHFFTGLFEWITGVDMFQVIQKKPDYILVKIVKNDKYTDADEKHIEKEIKNYVGDINLEIRYVDEIPPSRRGKRRFFISEVNSEYR